MAEPSIQAVVARYREDVSWVRELSFPAVVYDKSGSGQGVSLPNVGREAHTYLTHILRTYPDFPEYTVFVQGDPFSHMAVGAGPRELDAMVRDKAAKGAGFFGLAWYRIRCDGLGRPHDMNDESKRGRRAGFGKDIPVAALFETLFAAKAPRTFMCGSPAGLFAASRKRILARPQGFYRLALAAVEADPDDAANTGHALERLWQVIFNGYQKLNHADYLQALNDLSWPPA